MKWTAYLLIGAGTWLLVGNYATQQELAGSGGGADAYFSNATVEAIFVTPVAQIQGTLGSTLTYALGAALVAWGAKMLKWF